MNEEQKDLLLDLLKHDGLRVLLSEIDQLAQSLNNDVLKLAMTGASDERELLYRKLRADGASKLNALIKQRVQSLKPKG